MRVPVSRASGRADPFGLLVLAVVLALTVTIGIQAQASATDGRVRFGPEPGCAYPCVTGDMRH